MSDAPASLPPRDNGPLLDMVEQERAHLARAAIDPAHLWHRYPDKVAERQQYLEALLIRAGVSPSVETGEQRAEREFEAGWNAPPLSEDTAAMLDQSLDREDAMQPAERERRVDELRKEFGQEAYDKLVAEAKAGLKPGVKWRTAITSNRPALLLLAAYGRFNAAYERSRAATGLPRRRA